MEGRAEDRRQFERRKGDVFPWDEVRELRHTTGNLAEQVQALTGTFTKLMTRAEVEQTLANRINHLEERVTAATQERVDEARRETAWKWRLLTYILVGVTLVVMNLNVAYFQGCLLGSPESVLGEVACGASIPLTTQVLADPTFSGRAIGIVIYAFVIASVLIMEVGIRQPLPEELDPSLLRRRADDASI